MAVWSKLKSELDRAGKAAANAIDEGKVRLEIFRVRQLADKAAQALGYAVFRAKSNNVDLEPEVMTRLVAAVEAREADIRRLEDQIKPQAEPSPSKSATPEDNSEGQPS